MSGVSKRGNLRRMKAQFPRERGDGGQFERQPDAFRERVSDAAGAAHPVVAGRYRLFISLACPWACRTLIVRQLMGLEKVISLGIVNPFRDERGWGFGEPPGSAKDEETGFRFLSEAYRRNDPGYAERVTVPVLWDGARERVVNNSEDDICEMLAREFRRLAEHPVELFPRERVREQGKLAGAIYEKVNNGVYRAGFATSQVEYERACGELFAELDRLEARLEGARFLQGGEICEADWRLFCTLIRFDAVYHGHFKCNLRRILDYPNLHGYMLDLYQQPGIAGTVDLAQIKRHYYTTHTDINPSGIIPLGPTLDLDAASGRAG